MAIPRDSADSTTAVIVDAATGRPCQELKIEPHVPITKTPADPKTVASKKRLPGIRARRRMVRRMKTKAYKLSQRCRKKVEECFGWLT